VVAVDPAGYAAVVGGTPYPRIPVAEIGTASGGPLPATAPVPVLASPSAAQGLGSAVSQLTSLYSMGPISVRVAGELTSTPAQPGGGPFLVMPLRVLPGADGHPVPNLVLITGSAIDDAQLAAVAGTVIPGGKITFRSAVLAALTSSPLQHGAVAIVRLTIAAAAGFGLFILILALALGSADRELLSARLTVMGHERTTGLAMAEVMPALLAAVMAGAACALALPRLIGSALDLSGFSGSSVPVQLQPDLITVLWPGGALVLTAVVVLAAETRRLRRHGVTGILRAN